MIILDKLLAKLKEQGSKVLLFSQFKMMLDIIEDYLDWRGYKHCRLDGETSLDDRTSQMKDFNSPDSDKFIFIISTHAGGLGKFDQLNFEYENIKKIIIYFLFLFFFKKKRYKFGSR